MLRACVMDFGGSWDQFLPLAEFYYNNNYQSSIQMDPYEALYGRQGRSPIGWFEPGEARLLGTDLVRNALEKVKLIQDRLHVAQSRQKSYVDQKVCDVAYKYYGDPSHVLDFNTVQLDENLAYEEDPVAILDRQIQKLRSRRFPSMKVQWIG
ncbi:uncharacterized protein [Nicotiana sylvestris]|uniref:uncharacterized protein n=1 Tax=Nicotiana sylvestris TaxID=4096 RepID=UPI00388C5CD3